MSDTPPPISTKLFQINEDDLAELERVLPQWQDAFFDRIDNRRKVQIRRVQEIMSSIRWGYGPPSNVETIPAGE